MVERTTLNGEGKKNYTSLQVRYKGTCAGHIHNGKSSTKFWKVIYGKCTRKVTNGKGSTKVWKVIYGKCIRKANNGKSRVQKFGK